VFTISVLDVQKKKQKSYFWPVSIALLAVLFLASIVNQPTIAMFPSIKNLEQPMIPNEPVDLIDPETGKLQVVGWSINGETMVNDNSDEHANPLGWKALSGLRKRGINFFIL